jgi:non-ribosomal peptide synthetase-like protein
MQMLCLLATIVGASALAVWVGEGLSHSILATADLPLVLALSPFAVAIVLFGYAPCSIAFAVLLKRILVGRYSAGRVPVFSGFYVRHWIVQKAARAIPWDSLSGTEFECRALRALGARIGRRVHIHRGVTLDQGGWDLLDIGDDATLAQDAALRLVDLENGELLVGPVKIGPGATVDVRGGMSADSSLGSGAFLGALSWLPGGYHVPDGARFDGVPARAAGRAPDVAEVDDDREWSPDAYALALVTARATMRCLFAVPLTALVALLAWRSGVDLAGLARVLVNGSWSGFETFLLALAACAAIPATLLLQALFLRAIGNVPAGSVKRTSPAHLRIVLKTEVVQSAGTWISGTLFWPVWLRLAGMRVGRSAEVSTILGVVPELVEIGEESFLADGIYLGCPRLHRGVVTAALTTLGQRTFLGNHVVVLAGHRLKDDLLVGVCTVTAPESMRSNSAWFGHPPFELPRRPQSDFDRSLTHDPNLVLRCTRIAWELLRFALPFPAVFVASWSATWLANQHLGEQAFARDTLQLAALAVLVATSGPLFVWALKWILLGRVRPGQHPLWSSWCSRWDFHYVVWALYARAALSALEGTSFLAWYLRAMGCKVGRGVVLAGGFAQVVDPDMLEFEDGATVHALFQAHSFEERVLKIDRVRVGRDSNVGPGAVLFFGAEIGEGARVLPHSVVMKHERVPAWRTYVGCPVHETDG